MLSAKNKFLLFSISLPFDGLKCWVPIFPRDLSQFSCDHLVMLICATPTVEDPWYLGTTLSLLLLTRYLLLLTCWPQQDGTYALMFRKSSLSLYCSIAIGNFSSVCTYPRNVSYLKR
jgi:hypothetical protein